MPPVLPGGGQRVTVDTALKQPRILARAIADLALDRFVADRIFTPGTADQVAGGAAVFGRSESKYLDRDAEEVAPRTEYPRAGWSVTLFTAVVRKYGLEVPIADEAKRRNAMDEVARAQRKIANNVVKFIDGVAMALILSDPDVPAQAGSGDWTTGATDIIADLVTARSNMMNLDEGYEPDTLIVNPAQALDLMLDADLRAALPRESAGQSALLTGRPVPILGINIIETNRMTAGTALLLQSRVVGTIADEAPLADEGYVTYNPGAGQRPIYSKVYRNEGIDETIIRGARFPAMWITDPNAARRITGI